MKLFLPWLILVAALVHAARAADDADADVIPAHRAGQIFDAAPAKPSVRPKKPRRVLVWVTPPHLMEKDPHKGYCIPYGTAAMEALARKTGAFEAVVSGDLATYLPENIRQFDAIVMNNSSGPWLTPTDAQMASDSFRRLGADKPTVEKALRKSLLDYVESGGGIMAYHFAIGANRHWPQFQELLGATFTGHPWNEEVGIKVEEPNHPLVAAFDGRDFRLADEIYQYGAPYDRARLRVLLSLDTARTNMGVKWIERKDNDFALAWVKTHGKGRIFYTSFGHRTELYWHPRLLRFYLDGIQFACGDLDAPTASRTAGVDAAADALPPAPSGKCWNLVWHDEFDGTRLDESKWDIPRDAKRRDGWWMRKALSLDGEGHLVMTTLEEDGKYIDGCIRTLGKFEHAFGCYVARVKFHEQPGHWPAFWLMGRSVGRVGDDGRDGTEIDIMEKPWLDNRINHALHWDGYGRDHKSVTKVVEGTDLSSGFHTFSLWWSPNEYVFYIDGVETWRTSAGGVCQAPLYIKLSDEIGTWGGDIKKAKLPDRFIVDYVRVYDLADESAGTP